MQHGVPLGARGFPAKIGGFKGRGGTKESGECQANCTVRESWFGREM